MFTGWVGNDGNGGGGYRQQRGGLHLVYLSRSARSRGISWKVYQDVGAAWTPPEAGQYQRCYIGNYGDNSLLYFDQYRNGAPGSALYERAGAVPNAAVSGTLLRQFSQGRAR